MVHFPVSGVEVNPLLPLLVAFAVSALTAPAGVSGAFLLLPFQVSVLGFTSPAVSPTNLVYNIFATPGGVYRYVREGRVVWPLAWAVILGTSFAVPAAAEYSTPVAPAFMLLAAAGVVGQRRPRRARRLR